MAYRTPTVRDGFLQDLAINENTSDTLVVGSAEWFAWLEQHCSFRFETDSTAFTARKEQRPGGWYWYAYRRKQGKLYNTYIGKLEELTLDRLTSVAEIFDCDHKDERSVAASSKPLLKISQDASFQIHQASIDFLPNKFNEFEQITKQDAALKDLAIKLQKSELSLMKPLEPGVLTKREQEVLGLLTMGLTNAQIAERLVVSLSTVNTHVRSIYNKLEVTSRSAATRYAVEHHLI